MGTVGNKKEESKAGVAWSGSSHQGTMTLRLRTATTPSATAPATGFHGASSPAETLRKPPIKTTPDTRVAWFPGYGMKILVQLAQSVTNFRLSPGS